MTIFAKANVPSVELTSNCTKLSIQNNAKILQIREVCKVHNLVLIDKRFGSKKKNIKTDNKKIPTRNLSRNVKKRTF